MCYNYLIDCMGIMGNYHFGLFGVNVYYMYLVKLLIIV